MREPAAPPAADPAAAAVSVAMASYNGLRYIDRQVASILASLRAGDELVVVDDASTDGTLEWLRRIADPRVRIEANRSNLGVRRSFERALSLTRHDIVFLADQDDIWEPGKRDAFVAAFDANPDCMLVISDARVIDQHDAVSHESFMATRGGFAGSLAATLLRNRYLGCAMAVRRPVLDAALPIPPLAPMHDMWIGAIATRVGAVRYLPEPLLRYRRHGGNVSPAVRQSLGRMLRWRIDLLREVTRRSAVLAARRRAR
jgi:glycosyltransferase involved in cell wall biosynthesis